MSSGAHQSKVFQMCRRLGFDGAPLVGAKTPTQIVTPWCPFWQFGKCTECHDNGIDYVIAFGGVSATVAIWVAINVFSGTEYDALDITLQFLQILSIIQGFNMPWHSYVKEFSHAISVINFDVCECVCAYVRMCMCACVRACVRARARVCVHAGS